MQLFTFVSQYPAFLFPSSDQFTDEEPMLPTYRVFTPYLPYTWPKAVKMIRDFAPDIIIASYWIPFMAASMGWILRRVKASKSILLVHNSEFHEKWPLSSMLSMYIYRSADKLMLLSKAGYQSLTKNYPQINPDQLILGFHPIYNVYKKTSTVIKEPFTMLFFGFIKPYKGLDVLLEAMPQVIESVPNARLLIAGDVYGNKDSIRDLVSSLKLDSAVEAHLRYISSDEVGDFFGRASVVILPYRSATQSGIIAMAYAFGIPVIATDIGGLTEYIDHGHTGYLVKPGDPNSLADAICHFFENDKDKDFKPQIDKKCKLLSWQAFSEKLMASL